MFGLYEDYSQETELQETKLFASGLNGQHQNSCKCKTLQFEAHFGTLEETTTHRRLANKGTIKVSRVSE